MLFAVVGVGWCFCPMSEVCHYKVACLPLAMDWEGCPRESIFALSFQIGKLSSASSLIDMDPLVCPCEN